MSTPTEAEAPAPPKVFISYSWTSDEHANWVLDLATRLRRSSYVNVVLDRWDLGPGQDKFKFMEQMSTDPTVQKVLVICDKRYAERADARLGGVGTESTIISQEVYNQVAQEKFIPIVAERDADGEAFLPVFLKSRIYIDLSDPRRYEAGYEDLVLAIGGQRPQVKPPLGKAPSAASGGRVSPPTTHARRAFEDALLKDKPHAVGLAEDYLDALVEALHELRLDAGAAPDKEALPGVMLERLEAWTPLRDEFVEFLRFTARYDRDGRLFEGLPGFFEKCLALMTGRYGSRANDHISYICHETLLYAVAALLEGGSFEAVGALLGEYLRDNRDGEDGRLQRYTIFAHGETQLLTWAAQKAWDRQYLLPLWKLTQDRVTSQAVPFEALREADVLLYLRFLLEKKREGFRLLSWRPTTFTFEHARDYEWKCPTFERATSRRYFARFKVTLGVESKGELIQKWNEVFPQEELIPGRMPSETAHVMRQLANLDRMDST